MKLYTIRTLLVYLIKPEDTTSSYTADSEIVQKFLWIDTVKAIFWITCATTLPITFILLTT